jgi:hypothetical protein
LFLEQVQNISVFATKKQNIQKNYYRRSYLLHVIFVFPTCYVRDVLAAAGTHHLSRHLRPGVLRRLVADFCAPLFVTFLNHLYNLINSTGFLGLHLKIN